MAANSIDAQQRFSGTKEVGSRHRFDQRRLVVEEHAAFESAPPAVPARQHTVARRRADGRRRVGVGAIMTRFESIDWYDTPRYYDIVFDADTVLECNFL